jgi:oleandomycin transport system ATP-binding protein
MWDVVRHLVDDGSTVLLTTQYLEEADALADEITVIDHGSVIAHDTPYGLKRVVGGQRLSVRPSDPANLPSLERILAELTGAKPEPDGRDRYTVPVDGDEILPAAVYRLRTEGIRVDELSLHLPSLDEVFFTLTGTRTRTTTEEEDAA